MYSLIVEDTFVDRRVLQKLLSEFGECHVATNGEEAIEAFKLAYVDGKPYDLVCLDIKMPGIDGHQVLAAFREEEARLGIGGLKAVKVVMTTALEGSENVLNSFWSGCEGYLHKPVDKAQLLSILKELKLI